MTTLYLTAFVLGVLAAFAVCYWVIHHKLDFTNLGRIGSGLLLAGATLLDQLNVLPWGTILADGQAKLVGFGIALAMAILHVWDTATADPQAK